MTAPITYAKYVSPHEVIYPTSDEFAGVPGVIEWRSIPGYSSSYEVSNTGLVRVVNHKQAGQSLNLKQQLNRKGYYQVGINTVEGKRRQVRVHRLVALAFIPNPNAYSIINHKDEVKTNNNADNLEWCTVAYNVNYGTARKRQREAQRIAFARPEHSERMRELSIRRWGVEGSRARAAESAREHWESLSPEQQAAHKLQLSKANQSLAARAAMSDAAKRRWAREAGDGAMAKALARASERCKREVVCLTSGTAYASIIDAAQHTGVSAKGISECCSANRRGRTQTHRSGGLVWVYKDKEA